MNCLCLANFPYFLNKWFGNEVSKQGLEKASFDESPLYGYTLKILHIQPSLGREKYKL